MTTNTTAGTWPRWRGLLALSAATSVGLNVWHAGITAAFGAAVLASIAPVFLFWITHNLITDPGGVKNWREDKVGVGVAALVTLGAFAVSYVTQKDLALLLGLEPFVARILPVIVDLTIGVSSYKLMREAEQFAAEPVHRPDDAEHADAPEYSDTLTYPAPVHQPTVEQPVHHTADDAPEPVEQPVHQPAETAPEPVEQAGAPAVTSDNEVVHHPGAPVHQEPVTQPVQAVEPPLLVPVHRADAPTPSEAVQTSVVQPVRQRTDPEPAQTPVVQPVHLEQAAAVVQAGASELPIETVAQVYACLDAAWSQNQIASARVAAKRTIAKLIAAREELDTTAEEPELVTA